MRIGVIIIVRKWGFPMRTNSRLFGDCTPGSCDATTEEADFLERCFLIDCNNRDVCYNGVLREGGGAHLCAFCD